MTYPGPCVICGGTNYDLSMGGPTICPSCDCGDFGLVKIQRQTKEMERLRAEVERLTKERDFAREAVVRKCHQYDTDMITMRDALTREITEVARLRAALLVAQQWMPISPIDDEAKREVAQVRAALAYARFRVSKELKLL